MLGAKRKGTGSILVEHVVSCGLMIREETCSRGVYRSLAYLGLLPIIRFKIRRGEISVPVQVRSRAPIIKQLQLYCNYQKQSSAPQKLKRRYRNLTLRKKILSPRTKEITLQTAVIALLSTLVYIAFTSPANAAPEINDSQTGRRLGNISKNKNNPISSSNGYGPHGDKHSPTRITDPNSPYNSPYGNPSVNNSYASQSPAIINRLR